MVSEAHLFRREKPSIGPEVPFWRGPDVELVQDVIVPPGDYKYASVLVRKDGFPGALQDDLGLVRNLRASVRSRYAQIGIDVHDHGEQLYHSLITRSEEFAQNDSIELRMQLLNHGMRPVELPVGSRIFRPFYDVGRPKLINEGLEEMIDSGQISIEGEFGPNKDWYYAFDEIGENKLGVYVRISDENRMWIPPGDDPIRIDDNGGNNYRAEIDRLLSPIPESPGQKLWIGETKPHIKLGDSVHGILHRAVLPDVEGKGAREAWGTHVNSYLIDGGTDWRVRVEVLSSTTREHMPNFVYFYFVRD
jgi:hypothetical protein